MTRGGLKADTGTGDQTLRCKRRMLKLLWAADNWGATMAAVVGVSAESRASTRWIQLALGLVAMMSISSPQYVWTLFTKPLQDALGVTLPAVQVTFTLLIVLQTWLSPLQGYLVDRFGARLLIAAAWRPGWWLPDTALALF